GQYTLEGSGISTAGYTTTGPRIVSAPTTVVSRSAGATIGFAFDKPMSARSLSPSSWTLITPSGRRLRPLSVEMSPGPHGGRILKVSVPLPELGTYRLVLEPAVTDLFGHRLDQNSDRVPDGYPV